MSARGTRRVLFGPQGFAYLLDNVLCHPTLKTLLPELRDLLHDTAEKVRIAFIEILQKAKGIRTFKVTLVGEQVTVISIICVWRFLQAPRIIRVTALCT